MHGTFRATEVKPTKAKTLRPLHPSAALRVSYQRKLDKLIEEMNNSVVYWVRATYKNNTPIMALDDILPANALKKVIEALKKRWLSNFDKAAPKLAQYFATAAHKRTDKMLAKILRDGGFSVRFQMSKGMKDVLEATTAENVSLIKSIGSQHFTKIEGLVMRSAAAGRDLGTMAKALEKNYGVTKRRAALIARDQNNKASSNFTKVRQIEAGIVYAKWRHSAGGKKPRKSHVANSGKLYEIQKGWWDPEVKEFVWPGTLINCRCVSIPVIAGFS